MTVKTVDTANSLLMTSSKVGTIITSLELVLKPLPRGATREVVEFSIYLLGQVSDSLTREGNTLNRLGDS